MKKLAKRRRDLGYVTYFLAPPNISGMHTNFKFCMQIDRKW